MPEDCPFFCHNQGAIFAFFNLVFAAVCFRTHCAESQRLEPLGDHAQPFLASSSDEENEALRVYDDSTFNMQDPQGFTPISLEAVKARPKETPNMSPSSASTASSYNRVAGYSTGTWVGASVH